MQEPSELNETAFSAWLETPEALSKDKKKELLEQASEDAAEVRRVFMEENREACEADLLKDILRVADDELLSFPGTCSRAKYKKFGYFPETVVFDHFGNHEEFQRTAGLRDSRTTKSYRDRRARLKTEERVCGYYTEEIKPWCGAFERKSDLEQQTLVVGSDFHGREADRFALEVFIDVCRRLQPDHICLNGDIVDFGEVGRWAKNPNKLLDLQGEITWTVENILRPLRDVAPEANIDYLVGNHEYRLIRYLSDVAPSLASLDCLEFSELFSLKDLRISLVSNDAMLAPNEKDRKEISKQTWKIYGNCFVVTHGTSAGKFPADKELNKYGLSGISGHVHRPQYHSMPSVVNPWADWMTCGMMARNDLRDGAGHGDTFKTGPSTWTTGFGVVSVFPTKGVALQTPVIIKRGIAEFGGVTYRERDASAEV